MTSHYRPRAVTLIAMILYLFPLCEFAEAAAPAIPPTTASQAPPRAGDEELEIKRRETQIKADEYALKVDEQALKVKDLDFRRDEAKLARDAEHWKTLATFASVLVAVLAVAAPVAIGVRSLTAQRRIALDQARVQFQMKAVDLVLQGSANSKQAKERARALVALFHSDWLPERFAQDFDHASFRIDAGSSLSRRLELIKLLAENPESRSQILKDWYVINHGDWWFVDPLLSELTADERKALETVAKRGRENDKWSTERSGKPPWITHDGEGLQAGEHEQNDA